MGKKIDLLAEYSRMPFKTFVQSIDFQELQFTKLLKKLQAFMFEPQMILHHLIF